MNNANQLVYVVRCGINIEEMSDYNADASVAVAVFLDIELCKKFVTQANALLEGYRKQLRETKGAVALYKKKNRLYGEFVKAGFLPNVGLDSLDIGYFYFVWDMAPVLTTLPATTLPELC